MQLYCIHIFKALTITDRNPLPSQFVPLKPVPVQLHVKLSGAVFSIQLPLLQGGGCVIQISFNTHEQSVALNIYPGSHEVELSPQAIENNDKLIRWLKYYR